MKRILAIVAVAVSAAAPAAPAAPATGGWPVCTPRTAPPPVGVTQVGRARTGRLVTLALRSRAMGDVQPVRVLLPVDYDASGATRYPVLYLLHGAGGSYRSWIDEDHVQDLIGSMAVITVMPDGSQDGVDGGYSDWFGWPAGMPGGPPAWETFHIDELIPFIDAHFPTRASAAGRAIAGISMGGGGATKYAAEYPGTFGYVGTFSGEANPLLPIAVAFQSKTCKWGDPATEPVVWRDNDSTNLAANLRGVRVFVRSGDGTPGPYDAPTAPADPNAAIVRQLQLTIEFGAHLENEAFVAALHRAGVHGVDARFFPGSHSKRYWQRDTAAFLVWLHAQLRHPPRPPATFTVTSAHTRLTAWGWRLTMHRAVREFVRVRVNGALVTATGSGRIDMATPPGRRPGGRYRLRTGTTMLRLRADAHGRLAFTLSLGPSHRHGQTRFGAGAMRGWRTVTARVDAG